MTTVCMYPVLYLRKDACVSEYEKKFACAGFWIWNYNNSHIPAIIISIIENERYQNFMQKRSSIKEENLSSCWCNWPWIKEVPFAFIASVL